RRHRTDHQTQLAWVIDLLPVHLRDYIASFNPRFCPGTVVFSLSHERAGLLPFELHRVRYFRSEGLHRGADVPAHDATFVAQALHHLTRQICGNSEADPLVSAAAAEDRRVNAEQPAVDINKRASGV